MPDQRIQYNEKMVGAGHVSLSDTLNRLALVEHNTDGTHKDSLIVQIVETATGEVATGTTIIPKDDTIPQNTEGDQYLSQAITPANASNILLIEAQIIVSHSVTNTFIMALFQDSTANALSATMQVYTAVNTPVIIRISHKMPAGTTSATTFKIRAGFESAGTTTFNGISGARYLGGKLNSFIRITEITP